MPFDRLRCQPFSFLIVALLLCWLPSAVAQSKAEKSKSEKAAGPADYRSEHFLVHSDLTVDEAKVLLERLETMLALISAYWEIGHASAILTLSDLYFAF